MMSPARSLLFRTVLLAAAALVPGSALAGEIHDAVAAGDADRVAALLAADPSLASQPDDPPLRNLPLHAAAASGQVEIARLLVEAGADLNAGDRDGSTALDVAAIRRQPGMVALLVEAGADVNHRDANGACAISFAAFGGDSAIVRQLIDAGADLDYRGVRGTTLVHAAALRGLGWLLDLLVGRGQDPNVATDAGESPLVWAARGDQPGMMERLLALGADANRPDTTGRTPLHTSIMFRSVEAVRVLLDHGADPRRPDGNGNPPVVLASWGPDAELASLLLERGGEADRPGEDGNRPLWWAALNGNREMAAVLLDAGAAADPVEPKDGRTPLHVAALNGYGDLAELLLDRGASPAVRDAHGDTPLVLASRHGNGAVVRLLRERSEEQLEALPPRDLAAPGELADGEALVWYLGHSGWAVQTAGHLLVFDYHEMNRPADEPSLANGHVLPRGIAGLKVMVFASHEHLDHFDPLILGWRDSVPDLTYLFGFRPEESTQAGIPREVPAYEYVAPRETRTIGGVRITAIASNDSGEGFLVEVDGVTILHPGDHANRHRDFSGPYRAEIDFLAATGVRPDVAFFPISGCGFGDLEAVRLGVDYALDTLAPRVFLPMHAGNQGWRYREYIEACGDRFPETDLRALENKGDVLHVRNGRAG